MQNSHNIERGRERKKRNYKWLGYHMNFCTFGLACMDWLKQIWNMWMEFSIASRIFSYCVWICIIFEQNAHRPMNITALYMNFILNIFVQLKTRAQIVVYMKLNNLFKVCSSVAKVIVELLKDAFFRWPKVFHHHFQSIYNIDSIYSMIVFFSTN